MTKRKPVKDNKFGFNPSLFKGRCPGHWACRSEGRKGEPPLVQLTNNTLQLKHVNMR